MSCKGCIFEEVGFINEPCLNCKRNPEDNRQDHYYHGGIVDFVENELGVKLLTHQKVLLVEAAKRDRDEDNDMVKKPNEYVHDPLASGPLPEELQRSLNTQVAARR